MLLLLGKPKGDTEAAAAAAADAGDTRCRDDEQQLSATARPMHPGQGWCLSSHRRAGIMPPLLLLLRLRRAADEREDIAGANAVAVYTQWGANMKRRERRGSLKRNGEERRATFSRRPESALVLTRRPRAFRRHCLGAGAGAGSGGGGREANTRAETRVTGPVRVGLRVVAKAASSDHQHARQSPFPSVLLLLEEEAEISATQRSRHWFARKLVLFENMYNNEQRTQVCSDVESGISREAVQNGRRKWASQSHL
ncbi:unnamed protein product [Lampetra fluviatilis]